MTPQRWQQVKEILADAREQPQAERRDWLTSTCAGDAELLAEVTSFLEQEEHLEGFIESSVFSVVAAVAEDRDNLVGRKVGPYRLEKTLGRGGMGIVYLARREQDFEQEVALKLMPHSLVDQESVRRFQDERQILARLEHPNISRLLDGGTTEEGVPYFAMERVEGRPLDVYCDRCRLSVRRRLELFLPICSALQTAHQNLVVHRDLKPSNILVDESGVPKLLDFGIAKLLEADDPSTTRTTSRRILTWNYASPEQVQGGAVGTAADVYSLGVVLYKVLTGRLPGGLEKLSQLELMVAICQQDPAPPSVVVGRSESFESETGALHLVPGDVAADRDADPRALRKALHGDVDAIVLKALRKEPSQRYAGAAQLAADIRRHLSGLPVEARQGDRRYRLGKWAWRNRWALAGAGLVLGLALTFTGVLATQLRATEQARDRSELVSEFLIDLFQAAAPDRPAGEEPRLRDLLDLGRRQLESGLEGQPEVEATLALRLGEVYTKLGDYDEAAELTGRALARLRTARGEDHTDVARTLNNLAVIYFQKGDLTRAGELFRQCIDMRRRLGEARDLVKPMNNLAAIHMARGELDEAERIYRESLELRRAMPSSERGAVNLAKSQRSLGMVLLAQGRLDEAEEWLQKALETRVEFHGRDNPMVASVLIGLGRVEHERGELDAAEKLVAEGLATRRTHLGADHHYSALAEVDLASILIDRGESETARLLLTRALETLERIRPPGDRQIAEAEGLLGAAMWLEGRRDAALPCLNRAYEVLVTQRGPSAPETRRIKIYADRAAVD